MNMLPLVRASGGVSSSSRGMASLFSSVIVVMCILQMIELLAVDVDPVRLTIVNNCAFPIWPAIQPNEGHEKLGNGGFFLPTLGHRSIQVPSQHWTGRVWARTGCVYEGGKFFCMTGDCGSHVDCQGSGGKVPMTLAQFSIHHPHTDYSSYGVSLVDGFNLPMTVTPHEGKGWCPVVGCHRSDLLQNCPRLLRVLDPKTYSKVVACNSGCGAIGSDKLCCRNYYNNQQKCRPSIFSDFFKQYCPATSTYAHDSSHPVPACASPRELKVIFCH